MAAPPERTNVSPLMPMNSASRRRSRWSGLVQSAQPRWPPTEAISAALPSGSALRTRGSVMDSWLVSAVGSSPPSGGVEPGPGLMSLWAAAGLRVGRASAGQGERVDDPVEQLLADALGQGGLLEGQVVVDGVIRDHRGLVVADDGRQRRHHHHRALDVLLQLV